MEEESLRDSVSAAFDTHEDTPAPDTPAADPPEETPADEPDTGADTTGDDGPDADAPDDAPDAGEDGGAEEEPVDPDAEEPEDEAEKPEPEPATAKAPGGWKPEARELWAKLDPVVQKEVQRRETEVNNALRASTDARNFTKAFVKVVAPYEGMIAAEGSNHIEMVRNLLQTANTLRNAPPAHKAKVVAELIKHYAVDVNLLDQSLVGQMPEDVPPEVAAVRQEIAPVLQFIEQQRQVQTQAQQAVQRTAAQELEAFIAKAEFIDDVREDVADIIDLNTRRGKQITLQAAYDQAILLHPTISKIVERRRMRGSVEQQNSAAQKAKGAAVGVSGSAPAAASSRAKPDTIRASLEAAWDSSEAGPNI